MVPAVSRPFRGRAQGRAQGRRFVIQSEGGVSQKPVGGVSHHAFPVCAGPVRFFRARPDDPRRASGEGLDGSDPPFLTAGAVSRVGGYHTGAHARYHTHPPAFVGVAPVVCIPAGRLPGPRAGRTIRHTERPDA